MGLVDFGNFSKAVGLALIFAAIVIGSESARAAGGRVAAFVTKHCVDCHDSDSKKGELDLTALTLDLASRTNFATWVSIYDKVSSGEMPPAKKTKRPEPAERAAFTNALASSILASERKLTSAQGRATQRRLNRYEYEETLRDLLSLPYLEVKAFLPEDSVASGFNKLGDALDVSYVQMGRYLSGADFALRQAMAPQVARPTTTTTRYYAWEQPEFFGAIKLAGPKERRTFPLVGLALQGDLMAADRPKRPENRDRARRDEEAMGVVVSTYEPTEIRFGKFRAPVSGRWSTPSSRAIYFSRSSPR